MALIVSATVAWQPPPTVHANGPYRQVDPWPRDDRFQCLTANPSCGRDPWWAEWNDLPGGELVGFSYAPGLVADAKFVEALNLLQQWPEGRFLLAEAGRHGVDITVGYPPGGGPNAIGSYTTGIRQIAVRPDYVDISTVLLAAVLAHELKHADDDRAGLYQAPTAQACLSGEQQAYEVERQYLTWLTGSLVRQPLPLDLVHQRLSPADQAVAATLLRKANAADPVQLARQDNQAGCARWR
jgi:hypothetical protein